MTRALHELDRDEHRVLGAIEFVDATSGARVRDGLLLRPRPGGEAARIVRNRSGLHVVWSHAGDADLARHAAAFIAPPPAPPLGAVELPLRVDDPNGRYLSRSFALRLPRDPDPQHVADAGSLFRPQRVELFRSAAAPAAPNWSPVVVRVSEAASGDRLGGTLVEIRNAADQLLARGLTDWRGEAIVPVAGVPVTTWSEEASSVVVTEIAATVHAIHVAALGTRTPQADVDAGRPPALLPSPDPDIFASHAQRREATAQSIQLATGRTERVPLVIDLS